MNLDGADRLSQKRTWLALFLLFVFSNAGKAKPKILEHQKTQQSLVAFSGWNSLQQNEAFKLSAVRDLIAQHKNKEALRKIETVQRSALTFELKYVHFNLYIEILENLQDAPGVVQAFEKWEQDLPQNAETQTRSFRYLDAAIRAGLFLSAKQRVQKDWKEYTIEHLPPEVSKNLLLLSEKMFDIQGDQNELAFLMAPLLRNYPATVVSREAFEFFEAKHCAQRSLANESFLGSEGQKREHALRIFREFGSPEDIKNYAFELLGWNTFSVQKAKGSADEKAQLSMLTLAEDLQGMRQHQGVLNVLNALLSNAKLTNKMPLDKVFFLQARSFSSTQNPEKAQSLYQTIYTQYPKSIFAQQAAERQIQSLHSQRKYEQVVTKLKNNSFSLLKDQKNVWRGYWAAYLSRDKDGLHWFRKLWKKNTAQLDRWETKLRSSLTKHNGKIDLAARPSPNERIVQGLQDLGNEHFQKKEFQDLLVDLKHHFKKPEPAIGLLAIGAREEASYFLLKRIKTRTQNSNDFTFLNLLSMSGKDATASRLARQKCELLSAKFNSSEIPDEVIRKQEKLWKLNYPLAHQHDVLAAAREFGVNPLIIWALMRTESSYNARAMSPVGAKGLIQIMPTTGQRIALALHEKSFSAEDLFSPGTNIRFAAWYFKFLQDYFQGYDALAVAAYNAGPEAVGRWMKQTPDLDLEEFLENIPFVETYDYVKKVLSAQKMYARIYNLDLEPALLQAPLPLKLPEVPIF
jgi:soluble lytic murein transglycosylase-like protein